MTRPAVSAHGVDRRHYLIVRKMGDGTFLFAIGTDLDVKASLVRLTPEDSLKIGRWLVREADVV